MKKFITIIIFTLFLSSCANSDIRKDIEREDVTIEEQLSDAVIAYFGHRVDTPEQALRSIDFNEENGNLKIVVTTLAFIDETSEEYKVDLLDSCILLLEEIQSLNDIQEIKLIVDFPYEEDNGETNYYGVFIMDFTKERLSKINFEELDPKDLKIKADFFFEAPFD